MATMIRAISTITTAFWILCERDRRDQVRTRGFGTRVMDVTPFGKIVKKSIGAHVHCSSVTGHRSGCPDERRENRGSSRRPTTVERIPMGKGIDRRLLACSHLLKRHAARKSSTE